MKFDPITGELINEDSENEGQIQEVQNEEAQKQEAQNQGNMAFDPITGELIAQKNQEQPVEQVSMPEPEVSQPSGNFDPMTGKPLGQESQPNGGFDPMTGKPVKKKNKMIPIIGAAVAVVVILLAGLIISGVFSGPAGKITKAAANTFKEMPHLVDDLQGLSMLATGEYTLGAKLSLDDDSLEAEFRSKPSEKQIYAKVNIEDIPELTLLAGVDKSEVKLQIPEVLDQVFVYNFKGKNTGFLMEEFDEEEVELLNSLLEDLNASNDELQKAQKEVAEVIVKEFRALKFEKAEKEQYRVDGEKRTCSGYITEITEDNMINIIDGLEEVVNENLSEDLNELLEEQGESVEDLFEEMRDDLEDMDEIELSVYLYKNMLACVKLEDTGSDTTIEVMFKGGDYRVQNIEIVEETKSSEYTYEMKGSVSDSKEKFKFITNGNKDRALQIEYDYKSGDLSIEQDSYEDISMKGNLKASKSKIVFALEELVYGYNMLEGAELEITLSDSVKMGKFSGKEFDLGNATEDDFEDLADDIEDALYDNDLDDLLYYF